MQSGVGTFPSAGCRCGRVQGRGRVRQLLGHLGGCGDHGPSGSSVGGRPGRLSGPSSVGLSDSCGTAWCVGAPHHTDSKTDMLRSPSPTGPPHGCELPGPTGQRQWTGREDRQSHAGQERPQGQWGCRARCSWDGASVGGGGVSALSGRGGDGGGCGGPAWGLGHSLHMLAAGNWEQKSYNPCRFWEGSGGGPGWDSGSGRGGEVTLWRGQDSVPGWERTR